jgi:hypothetical protein
MKQVSAILLWLLIMYLGSNFSEEVATVIIYSNVFFCVNQLCFQKF